jgi:hypothetical protein
MEKPPAGNPFSKSGAKVTNSDENQNSGSDHENDAPGKGNQGLPASVV